MRSVPGRLLELQISFCDLTVIATYCPLFPSVLDAFNVKAGQELRVSTARRHEVAGVPLGRASPSLSADTNLSASFQFNVISVPDADAQMDGLAASEYQLLVREGGRWKQVAAINGGTIHLHDRELLITLLRALPARLYDP